ncbi:hypothetical protein [Planktothrix pseudagardhii]|uniref:Uncharacterized protein n=1 Tax=Planktothrix pseudagardhii TaxID=132604 RepID=A0A9W4CGL3_9CYAN|nr:hypothetical protein [Planktothrix pseudagardhii]CAD5927673.1 hypothetical protein NO713_01081 [Planktothrix pseudagardhii]
MKLLTLPSGWLRPQFSLEKLPIVLLVGSSLTLMATNPAKAQLRLGNPMSCGQVRMHGGMGGVGFNGQVMNICIPTSTLERSFQPTANPGADLTIQPTRCGTGAATGVIPISLPNGNGLFAEGGLMLDQMFPMNQMGGGCPPMSVIMQLAGECSRGDSDSCGGLNRIRRSGCAI